MDESRVWHPLSCLDNSYDGKIALIQLNTSFSSNSDIELFSRLWDHAVLKTCTDGAANVLHDCVQLNDNRYIPTFISGDFDSIRPEVLEYYREHGSEIISTPDQDETDFTKCLRLVVQKLKDAEVKCDRIITHAGIEGRLDHIMACINTLYTANKLTAVPVYLLTAKSLTCLLPSGKNVIHVDSLLRGSWCSLVPIGCPCERVVTSGLVYNLDKRSMRFGDLISTSNAFDGSPVVNVECDQPLLWSMGLKL